MQKVKRKSSANENEAVLKKTKSEKPIIKEGDGKDLKTKKNKTFEKSNKAKKIDKGKAFKKDKDGRLSKFTKNGKADAKKFQKNSDDKNKSEEKPNWSEMRKKKKQLRVDRRKAKVTEEGFEISHKAKLLATQLQRKKTSNEFSKSVCEELHKLLKNKYYKTFAMAHDMSRVIQVVIKNGDDKIRSEVGDELLPILIQMIQSKYAQHSVKTMLKLGTDSLRHRIIEKFYGNVVTLVSHSISAPIIDYAYGEFATLKEKLLMQQEFYGDIYKNSKDVNIKKLSDAYKDSPEMKPAILNSIKANIQRILDKNLHDGELFHSVLYDYLSECTLDERNELISTLCPLIVPLSNSLPGVQAASMCIFNGTNKDKKSILKVVKEHVISVAKHKTGYRLLIAIFAACDDTVLVKKTIVTPLLSNIRDIVSDHWGRMVIHWLVKPSDLTVFHPTFIKWLKEGLANGNSKKDESLRVNELKEPVLPALNDDIVREPGFWLKDANIAMLTVAVLTTEPYDKLSEAVNSLAKLISDPEWKVKENDVEKNGVEDAGLHQCINKIIQADKKKDNSCSFGRAIVSCFTKDTIQHWLATNRGCFVILHIIENNNESVKSLLDDLIESNVGILKKQSCKGAQLLLEKYK